MCYKLLQPPGTIHPADNQVPLPPAADPYLRGSGAGVGKQSFQEELKIQLMQEVPVRLAGFETISLAYCLPAL